MTAWSSARADARRLSRERAEHRVAQAATGISDPLVHPSRGLGATLGRVSAILVGAFVAHGMVLGGFYGVSAALGGGGREAPDSTPIEVVMVQPPPEPEPVVEPEPQPEPEAPAPEPTRPKPRPERKRRRPEPPPDPTDVPDEPAPPPKKKVRRVVGLDLGSTTKGGSGPSFAVGNTRMGSTAEKAEKPVDAPLPKARSERTNRKATRAPIGSGGPKITKPKYAGPKLEPRYPEDYRAQNLEAQIKLEIRIGADGKVESARVVKGSRYEKFEQIALATAKRQRWVPAKRGDSPIAYTQTLTYYFRLED